MAISDKEENIILRALSAAEAIEDEFIANLARVNRRLERDIIALLNASENVAAVDVALAKSQIDRIILNSGFAQSTQNLLNDGYQKIINESFKMYKNLYDEAFRFSDASLQRITAIKQLDFNQFQQLSNRAATELNRIVVDMQFGGLSKADAIKTVSEDVIAKLGAHVETWAATGSAAIARESSTMLAEDNGITKFIYIGPNDSNTRKFCKKHLNQIKTKEEWNALDNGQINPVFSFAGGFRCRHQIVGVR